jgi:5'(3')-deoxyribonucleotidase
MAESRFVLGVDLDGVCANFIDGLRPIAAEWLGVDVSTLTPDPSYGFKEWDLCRVGGTNLVEAYGHLHRYAVTQRDLFLHLPIIPGADVTLRKLAHVHHVRVRIITHRLWIKHFHETAIQQTVKWLDSHDIPYYDLCFMSDKGAVGADLYLEDSPQNIRALRDAGKKVIIFSNSTNKRLSGDRANTWHDIEGLVLRRLAEWKAGGGEARRLSGV